MFRGIQHESKVFSMNPRYSAWIRGVAHEIQGVPRYSAWILGIRHEYKVFSMDSRYSAEIRGVQYGSVLKSHGSMLEFRVIAAHNRLDCMPKDNSQPNKGHHTRERKEEAVTAASSEMKEDQTRQEGRIDNKVRSALYRCECTVWRRSRNCCSSSFHCAQSIVR